MLKNRTILSDVDGVLLHWINGFTNFLHQHHNIIPTRIHENHAIHEWLEVHPDKANELIMEFNSSYHFSMLEPLSSAHSVVPKLYNEGYSIIAITSCSSESTIAALRKKNLQKYFGNIFENVYCLDIHDDKKGILEQYKNAFWIEDTMKWAVTGAELGHKTFLIDHSYNRFSDDPRVSRVKNWHIIYDMIYDFNYGR